MIETQNSRAVTVADLRISLRGTRADVVEGLSFHIARGEVLGLVGESGSGKTTAGLALLGYCRRGLVASGGQVKVHGHAVLEAKEDDLQKIRGQVVSYVPQDPSTALNPSLRVREQIAQCLRAHGARPDKRLNARIGKLLTEVHLPSSEGFLRAYPHQLSGGQQQRIAIAMAFSNRPSVIVMDEPTTGLDVTTQRHILRTIKQLCNVHETAALYISHDLAVVSELADRVAVMYAGRLVEVGPAHRVLSSPAHPYTKALIEAVPDVAGRLELRGIPGRSPPPGRRPRGCLFAPRCAFRVDACSAPGPTPVEVGWGHVAVCLRPMSDASGTQRPYSPKYRASTPTTSAPILAVSGLHAWYGRREALHGITLGIQEGECLALVGESGSGKTTLARSIAGLHKHVDGEMRFAGRALTPGLRRRDLAMIRGIQYIFQNPYASLNPRRTVGQSLAIALRLLPDAPGRRQSRGAIEAALDAVALDAGTLAAFPDELSGGQRQRAAIARALIVEPSVLICDEITSSLDVSVQAVIVELLLRLQRERKLTVMFVTHNLALVRAIADSVAVMDAGAVVDQGSADDLLSHPRALQTAQLIEDTPHVSAARMVEL